MTGSASRRGVLAGAAAALAAAATARAQYIATGVTPTVMTSNGPVVGLMEAGIPTFKGLRYGAPPVGPLRWAPPARPAPWKDPALAAEFGPAAMQLASGGSAVRYPGTVGAALNQLMNAGQDVVRQSEDCLFLNLWTPALDRKPRPVMVWFHGGGFNYGSGNWPVYDGHNLAKNHDVVLVSVTHRLNAFGYLYLGEAGGDPASGNAGMLDLIAALQWVRDNAAAFGGDPGNVTVFGQSGGGAKVATTLAMPAANGLRHKGIVESGAALRSGDKAAAAEQARRLMRDLGAGDLAALRAVPAPNILAAVHAQGAAGLRWGPVMDDVAITGHPFDPTANPVGRDVAVMVGCTSDEQTLYNVGFDWWGKATDAQALERLRGQYGPLADQLWAAAQARYPNDSPSYRYVDVTSKAAFVSSAALAERKSAQPTPVYMYVWAWGAPVDGGLMRAPHTMEIPFAFDNVDKGPIMLGTAASTQRLGRQASGAWTAFARTGDPNVAGSGLPHWPRYDAAQRATMIFNTQSRVENDPYAEFRKLMPPVRPA
ncbi:MAG: carboxylesterase/lipase family protein [Phenylobacterium sp.]|nr:MAG: carboxylesterase/lipase family protein [Phenylobacterium sp.]